MKNVIVWLPLTAVLGGIVGAWGPMEELRVLKEREDEAKVAARPAAKRGGFDPLAQFINVPDAAKRPRRTKKPATPIAKKGKDVASTNDAPSVAAADATGEGKKGESRPLLKPEDLQARIDEAAELWRTRIQLARATALENLGIAADAADAFDTALSDMNDRLRESMQAIADAIANEEKMTPEIGARLMSDMASAMVETYDHIGGCVDGAKRGEVSELNLAEFIDPSVAEPLVAVQDKLDGRMMFGGSGRGK